MDVVQRKTCFQFWERAKTEAVKINLEKNTDAASLDIE